MVRHGLQSLDVETLHLRLSSFTHYLEAINELRQLLSQSPPSSATLGEEEVCSFTTIKLKVGIAKFPTHFAAT